MADIISLQELADAKLDAQSLERFINGGVDEEVLTRLSQQYPTMQNFLFQFQKYNSRAYKTFADMDADKTNIPAKSKVTVTNDGTASNNGDWQWDGVAFTKSAYDPLTQAEADATTKANAAEANAKDYFKNNANVRFEANAQSNINYTTSDRNLTFSGNVYVITNAGTKSLATPQVLNLPSNTRYRIEYNISTNTLRAVAFNAARSDSWALAGIVTVSATSLTTSDFAYFVDGAAPVETPSEYGELINTVPSRIAFDTVAKTLTITSSVRVLSAAYTYVPSSTVVVDFPSTSGNYSLVFNKGSRTFLFKPQSTVSAKNDVVLAYITFAATTFKPTVTGISSYSIDGVSVGKYADLKTLYDAEIIQTSGTAVNFDFKNSKITIPVLRILVGNSGDVTTAQEIDISSNPNSWHKLMYNQLTKLFSVKVVTSGVPDGMDDVVAGYFIKSGKSVYGVSSYAIDGEVVKGFRESIRSANFRTPYGDVTSTYKGRTLPELNTLYTSIGVDLAAFYALYDALVAAYPTYITKTNLGADKDGNQIYQYQFNAPDINTAIAGAKKPKIIILSNIHGWEKASTYILYQSLKEVCEQWQNNESLEALRWGANLIVVPVINPSGFISLARKNSNGVDIERNFPSGWMQGLPTDETYGGSAPLSEPEAVIINNLLANNLDAVHFMSCHSFSAMNNTTFPNGVWCWIPSATDFGVNLAKSTIVKNSIESKKRYPFISTDYVGYADKGAPEGSAAYHASIFHNIQGATFEINGRMYWESGQPFLSEAVVTCGSDLLINWLLMNIKYATELYNSRVNI